MLSYFPKQLQIIIYAVSFYFPFYLFWGLAFILTLSKGNFFSFILSFALFLAVIVGTYFLYRQLVLVKVKWLMLGVTWFILTFYIAFLIAISAGGIEKFHEQYQTYLTKALEVTLDSQLITLPYLVVVVYLEKKMDEFMARLLKISELNV